MIFALSSKRSVNAPFNSISLILRQIDGQRLVLIRPGTQCRYEYSNNSLTTFLIGMSAKLQRPVGNTYSTIDLELS